MPVSFLARVLRSFISIYDANLLPLSPEYGSDKTDICNVFNIPEEDKIYITLGFEGATAPDILDPPSGFVGFEILAKEPKASLWLDT